MLTARGTRARLVLVDDDESFRESLAALLRVHDFEVRAFSSTESFLECQPPPDADCLLVDASLAGSADEIGRGSHAPIIFVTGYAGAGIEQRVRSRGGVACLSKPFEEDELLSALSRALGLTP
jgi:FixJ family two-component response regulator